MLGGAAQVCGCCIVVVRNLAKVQVRVRFPSSAPSLSWSKPVDRHDARRCTTMEALVRNSGGMMCDRRGSGKRAHEPEKLVRRLVSNPTPRLIFTALWCSGISTLPSQGRDAGSNPARVTKFEDVAQLASALPRHGRVWGFKSPRPRQIWRVGVTATRNPFKVESPGQHRYALPSSLYPIWVRAYPKWVQQHPVSSDG